MNAVLMSSQVIHIHNSRDVRSLQSYVRQTSVDVRADKW